MMKKEQWRLDQEWQADLSSILSTLNEQHEGRFTVEIHEEAQMFFQNAIPLVRQAVLDGRVRLSDAMVISKLGLDRQMEQTVLLAMVMDAEPVAIK